MIKLCASLPVVQDLASLRGRISLIELRVPGTAQEIQAVADQVAGGEWRGARGADPADC